MKPGVPEASCHEAARRQPKEL
ncbi:hypothetical protein AWZ03_014735, partial [Drosophila navojoa]